jgi:prephenate dehydratase
MNRFAQFWLWSLVGVVGLSDLLARRASRYPFPQALGQCSQFLATHLPAARLVKVSSTAAAAEAVSTQADDDDAADSAAICSKICLQLFGNLEMLQEGIQDSHREFTPDFFWRAQSVVKLSSQITSLGFTSSRTTPRRPCQIHRLMGSENAAMP